MFSIILLQSRLVDVTVTLSAVGPTSRRARNYEVVGKTDDNIIVMGFVSDSLDDALSTYHKWEGDPL